MSNKFPHNGNKILPATLADIPASGCCTVTEVGGSSMQRLAELGLTLGSRIHVLRTAPLGDPMEICLRGYRLCLRKQTARQIRVKPCTE